MKKTMLMLSLLTVLGGCHRVTEDMGRQPRHNADSRSALFADQQAARAPVPDGIVHASGDLAQLSSGRLGAASARTSAPLLGDALLHRGQDRYVIYCLPCHGVSGAGDGEVVRRGFPAPPPLTSAALLGATDARLTAAIRQGVGVMGPFADRVSPADAAAIVAYLRVLQRRRPIS
ncbi:MAG TPA: cytochrome c [Burkholderiaceae bacterium]|jgi:mono/diheme cytochrome c family protein